MVGQEFLHGIEPSSYVRSDKATFANKGLGDIPNGCFREIVDHNRRKSKMYFLGWTCFCVVLCTSSRKRQRHLFAVLFATPHASTTRFTRLIKWDGRFRVRSTSKISDRLAIISFSLEDSFPAISSSPTYGDVAKPRETTSDDVTNDVTDLC